MPEPLENTSSALACGARRIVARARDRRGDLWPQPDYDPGTDPVVRARAAEVRNLI